MPGMAPGPPMGGYLPPQNGGGPPHMAPQNGGGPPQMAPQNGGPPPPSYYQAVEPNMYAAYPGMGQQGGMPGRTLGHMELLGLHPHLLTPPLVRH